MTADQLLSRLKESGISVELSEGRLKVVAPKGAVGDDLREAIRARRDELVALLDGRQQGAVLRRVPRHGGELLPLSRFQRRLWIMCQLRGKGDAAYVLGSAWPVSGTSDPAIIEQAIRDLARRHEIIRTCYPDVDGNPHARLLGLEAVSIARHSIDDLDSDELGQRLNQAVSDSLLQPFDLQNDAAFRWQVITTPQGLLVLVATHHIAIDHWSFAVLRQELDRSIAAVRAGEELAPPDLQYVDYAAWQASRESSETIGVHLDWWMKTLAHTPELSAFPPDRVKGGEQVWRTASFSWDESLTAGLRLMAREERVTLYMVLVSLCAAAVRRQTGQTDIVIGSSTGSRERAELETMIGPFVNVLALRLDLDDDPSFGVLLQRSRDALLDGHAHSEAPFEMIVEKLNPSRSFDHTPIFQVAVVLHNGAGDKGFAIEGGGAMYDFTWFAREESGRLVMGIEYRADLYSERAVGRIMAHLEALARSAIEDRSRPVSRMPLTRQAEAATIAARFSPPPTPVAELPFPAAFAVQAALTPRRPALTCSGTLVDYGTLDATANRIARLLQARGVGRGDRVGLCVGRSPLMVAAMIGVQKLGAAYIPLDPAFPASRLAFMVTDSAIGTIISETEQAVFASSLGDNILLLDEGSLSSVDAADVPACAEAPDAAYVIYTSGSTGRPNGVVVSHGALTNFLAAMRREPGLSAGDVVVAITTMSFDISILELLAPLLVGARVELVGREVASDGKALAEAMARCGATLLQATPATWRLLLEAGWTGAPGLRALCGGESLPRDLAEDLLPRVGELWNMYGPTEATVWCTAGRLKSGDTIHIGQPIANTRIYIVDENGELAPPGIAGEILIGGEGLAQGYHARPELTAARFVTDRFSNTRGGRLYRTGDLGLWTEDGLLYHLGRADHQVKIRGYRIELGEIETALARHPAVRQAVVVPQGGGTAARLVAYCVLAEGEALTTSEARSHLQALLPDYMVPSFFEFLDAIPLTPNGKIDRKALPPSVGGSAALSSDYLPCSPGLETDLAEIWKDVLNVARVGANDNFFEIGGHSLLSLRVVRAVAAKTGLALEPRMLFTQSLRNIATALRRNAEGQEKRA